MVRLATSWFGALLLDGEQVVGKRLFPKDPEAIADRLNAMETGEVLAEEKELAKEAGDGDIIVGEKRLQALGRLGGPVGFDIEATAMDHGFGPEILRGAMMALGKRRIGEVAEDRFVIQAVSSIDDLNKMANILSERLHEWFSLHFPEFSRAVPEERYVDLVAEHTDRDAIAGELGMEAGSVGADLSEDDRAVVQRYATMLRDVYKTRKEVEAYVERRMTELAPNITFLTGPVLGAKLIAAAGGLERLARMPSSTVQMLGAEKAFFRHLTEGGEMPKHGVIFQHPLVHASPWWQRGKIARAFANKISLASKADVHTKRFMGEELKTGLEKRIDEIRRNNVKMPDKKRKVVGRSKDRFVQRSGRRGYGRGDGRPQAGGRGQGGGRGRGRRGRRMH